MQFLTLAAINIHFSELSNKIYVIFFRKVLNETGICIKLNIEYFLCVTISDWYSIENIRTNGKK